MRIIFFFLIIVIASCGQPDYPDSPQETTPQQLTDTLKNIGMTSDTFKFVSAKDKYYEQVRPVIIGTDGESIFIDGNEFRILNIMDTTIHSHDIVSHKVQGISGIFANVNYITMAFSEDKLKEVNVEFLGVFTKDTPKEWILNETQEKANEEKIVKADRVTTTHVVGTGQSVYSVSRMYGMKMKELIELNNLKTTVLHPRQKLKVYVKN